MCKMLIMTMCLFFNSYCLARLDANVPTYNAEQDTADQQRCWNILNDALMQGKPFEREIAVRAISMIEDERSLRLLERGATDPEADVRAAAIYSLGQRRELRSAIVEKLLNDRVQFVRMRAVEAIGNNAAPSFVPLLVKVIEAGDPLVTGVAMLAAQKMGRSGISVIAAVLEHGDEKVRIIAAQIMAEYDGAEKMQYLRKATSDASAIVKAVAFIGLARWGNDSVEAGLKQATDVSDSKIRADAAVQLYILGVREYLTAILQSGDKNIKYVGIRALRIIRDRETILKLIFPLLDEKEEIVRVAAVEEFQRIANKNDIGRLNGLLDDSSEWVRFWAAAGIVKNGAGQRVRPVMEDLLKSPSPMLRNFVIDALREIGDRESGLAIRSKINDQDAYVRVAVIKSLTMLKELSLQDCNAVIRDASADVVAEGFRSCMLNFENDCFEMFRDGLTSTNVSTKLFAASSILRITK